MATNVMTTQKIRRNNLEIKISEFGSLTAFCDAVNKPQSHLSQIRSERRSLGEKMARDIEAALSLPVGWLDQEHCSELSVLDEAIKGIRLAFKQHELSKEEAEMISLFRKLTERDKGIVKSTIKLHANSKGS